MSPGGAGCLTPRPTQPVSAAQAGERRAQIRWLIAEIGIPILMVCAVNAAFARYVARTPTVPVPQLFNSPVTSGKILAFRERMRSTPTLDVLLLGLSPMMRVNGERLEHALAEQTGRAAGAFNFSGPFHSLALDQRLMDGIVLPFAKPAVVVYGLSPLSLLGEDKTPAQVDEWLDAFPVFTMYTGSLVERLRGFVQMHVALLRYRQVIRDAFAPPFGWKPDPVGQATHATACGDVPLMTEHAPVSSLSSWERGYQKQFADFDAVLRRTLLFDHLAKFAAYCREHGIELVVLNHPVHPLFLDLLPDGRQDYDRYVTRLREVAARAGMPLYEPVPDGIGPPALYTDTVHNDAAGGAWLTEALARYLAEVQHADPRMGEHAAPGQPG